MSDSFSVLVKAIIRKRRIFQFLPAPACVLIYSFKS